MSADLPRDPAAGSGEARPLGLVVAAGLAVAVASLPFAAATGAPYLSLGSLNGFLVAFAVGLFAALFATPFLLERAQRAGDADGDRRWERAFLGWGGIALTLLAAALAVGLAGSFSGDSLAGSVGLVVAGEALLVLATLLVWVLSG